MNIRAKFLVLLLTVLCAAPTNAADYGSFIGKVVAEWLKPGREMRLIEPFAYLSPSKVLWDAPAGSVVDGASIPQVAWTIIGGPYEGNYREASVIHDVACVRKNRPWQEVHYVFYTAMLASGVGPIRAKVMYAAVYHFGPRWERNLSVARVPFTSAKQQAQAIASTAMIGEVAQVTITPGPTRPQKCKDCMDVAVLPDLSPDTADISVTFAPTSRLLTTQQFDALKAEIEAKDLSLSEIENYTPGATSN